MCSNNMAVSDKKPKARRLSGLFSFNNLLSAGWIRIVSVSPFRSELVVNSLHQYLSVEALIARGEMHQSGLDAYAKRDPAKSGIYSFEQRPQSFAPELERRFRAVRAAWNHFNAQPPGYRRLAIWWVSSAKRDETRLRRLTQLIEASGRGMRIGALFGQTGPVPTPAPAKATSVRKSATTPSKARR